MNRSSRLCENCHLNKAKNLVFSTYHRFFVMLSYIRNDTIQISSVCKFTPISYASSSTPAITHKYFIRVIYKHVIHIFGINRLKNNSITTVAPINLSGFVYFAPPTPTNIPFLFLFLSIED